MLDAGDAAEVAGRFSLGEEALLSGPVARGEVGQVWRLTTSLGVFAVKEPFDPVPDDEVRRARRVPGVRARRWRPVPGDRAGR